MTPEEKITALVEHIKKEFPKGCRDVICNHCVLRNAKYNTIEHDICDVLYNEMNRSQRR